jgi:hypothetical protein
MRDAGDGLPIHAQTSETGLVTVARFGKILGQHRDSTASQIVRFSQDPFCLTMEFRAPRNP